jgi:NAD(P)-dependent dehydrogenase (short-subunit alcohol dehydrogenase family)
MTRSNVITGASKIIGMAAIEALAAAGWKVIRVARHTPAKFDSLMLVRHGPFMPRRSGSQRRLHEGRRVDRAQQAETRSLTAQCRPPFILVVAAHQPFRQIDRAPTSAAHITFFRRRR